MLQEGNYGSSSLRNILLMIKAITSHYKSSGAKHETIYFIIEKRLWIEKLTLFAIKYNITLLTINNPILSVKQTIYDYYFDNKFILLGKTFLDSIRTGNYYFFMNRKLKNFRTTPKIMVEQIIQIFQPNSFWKFPIPPSDIVFVSKFHKINKKELEEIRELGMSFLSLSPIVSYGIDTDYYRPDNAVSLTRKYSRKHDTSQLLRIEERKISLFKNKYYRRREYWKRLFNEVGVKIYISHDRWNIDPVAASSAIRDNGGVSAIWQTSYYEYPTSHSSIYADLYFSFSTSIINAEKMMNSELKYIVCTGFLYDHYFKEKNQSSQLIREDLLRKGAKKIICIIDGGSKIDERWTVGATNYQNDYKFWLEKLLDQDWLGLIIKSKGPGSLKKRLGPVSELLSKAVESGRCYFSDKSDYFDKNLNFRVADAAIASDIAIHFCLYAGTAGLEAKMAGIPTLFFDRFGLKDSQFYKLGVDKVVFDDWGKMWNVIKENFDTNKIPLLGDWSPIIDDIDPFRDGKAAYRMNTYLNWLLEGFKKGLARDDILEMTAERYATEWGDDKVISLT